jgi:hypothetical protein
VGAAGLAYRHGARESAVLHRRARAVLTATVAVAWYSTRATAGSGGIVASKRDGSSADGAIATDAEAAPPDAAPLAVGARERRRVAAIEVRHAVGRAERR